MGGVYIMRSDILEQAKAIRAATQSLATSASDEVVAQTTMAIYDVWAPNTHYNYNQPLVHEGQLYRVAQAGGVDSLEHQPPNAEGMLAVYRPINVTAAGTQADPIPFTYGMDCHTGTYYSYEGQTYLCNGDMIPCVWLPTTDIWQWSLVTDAPSGGDDDEPAADEWPEWVQPTGAHDAYAQGAQVSHNGKHWISGVDGNVWEPGVYGWTEYAEA